MIISAKTTNLPQFRRDMNELQKRMHDTKPLMKSLAITTHGWILKNARSGGALLKGKKWAPLAPSTIAGRRRGSSVPLHDSGHMMKQWSYDYSKTQAVIGNPMDIAVYHQEGTGLYGPKRKRYTIKPRNKKWLRFVVGGFTVGKWGKAAKRSRLNYAFAKEVQHPGVPQRRMLPTEKEIGPSLLETLDFWMKKALR